MEVKNCQSRKKNARNIRIDDNTITRKTRSTCKHTRVNRKLRVNLAIFGEFTFVHAKIADAGTNASRSRVRAFVVGPFGARTCADWSSNDSASHQHSRKNCKQIARLDERPRHLTHTHTQAHQRRARRPTSHAHRAPSLRVCHLVQQRRTTTTTKKSGGKLLDSALFSLFLTEICPASHRFRRTRTRPARESLPAPPEATLG